VPLALMGLNEGVNVFVDEDGKFVENVYVPAYARRYPFMLARLTPEAQELSLCFDPTSDLVGDFEEGSALFDGEQPSETTKGMLGFCEQFEQAGLRSGAFVKELEKHGLLIDGEVAIQQDGPEAPKAPSPSSTAASRWSIRPSFRKCAATCCAAGTSRACCLWCSLTCSAWT
jgi:hypothetical protein